MDRKQKYIRTENGGIIVFPIFLSHDEFRHFKPVSAGFCYVDSDSVSCFGDSFTLKLKSDEKDSAIATQQFFGYQ